MASDFSSKVAIVTGASSGIGEAIAVMLASRGAVVSLCGRDKARLEEVLQKCQAQSGGQEDKFMIISGDLTHQDVRKTVISKTIERFGRLDILVPNAGIALPDCDPDKATEEAYDLVMNTNVKSVFFLTQEAIPHLEKTKGSIVMISSVYSVVAAIKQTVYAMSKAAIDHYTRSLALTLGPKGIRANCVNPGHLRTHILRSFIPGQIDELAKQVELSEGPKHPLHGRCATPDEIAEVVCFLASDAAGFVTGQCVLVDAGRHFLQS